MASYGGGGGGGGSSPLGQLAKQAANKSAFPGETKEQWNRSFNQAYRAGQRPTGHALAAKGGIKTGGAKAAGANVGQDRGAYAKAQANAQTYRGQSGVDWNANYQKAYKTYQPASKFAGPGVPLNSPLLNPSRQLSGQSLMDAATALADSQTQGTITELAKQIASNNANTRAVQGRTGSYFNQLGQQAAAGTQASQSIASGLNQTLQGIGQNTQSQLQGIQGSALGTLSQYTPGQGVAASAAPALSTELGRQQGLAAQQAASQQTLGAQQGANYAGLSALSQGTGALRGQERLGAIGRSGNLTNQPIQSKLAAAIATRGADIKTALGKLRQQEITNNLASTGLGIKQQGNVIAAQKNQITQSSNQANQKLKSRELDIIQQNDRANQYLRGTGLSIQQQNNLANQALKQMSINRQRGGPSGGGGARALTPHEQNAGWATINKIASQIQDGQRHGLSGTQIRQAAAKHGYSDLEVTAAWSLLGYKGSLTPGIWNSLKQAGFTNLGYYGGRPIAVQKTTPGIGTGVAPRASGGNYNFGL